MSNGNEPAMPLYESRQWVDSCDPSKGEYDAHGLTKREYFAGLIAQGLASDSQFAGDLEEMATCAVSWADALLKKLEEAK